MNKSLLKSILPPFVMRAYERQLFKETHINRALRSFREETEYVEIGVRDGACIRQIGATRKYAVDPAPVDRQAIESDGTRMFELTSDRFFEEEAPDLFTERRVHVALVDGLHEFRQALRDVLNLERYMAGGGVVFIHDCNPLTRRHTESLDGPWNGDVWKVAYFLNRHRPDLDFHTLDCDWGLGVLSGFTPGEAPPLDADLVDEIAALDYDVLAQNRSEILDLRSPINLWSRAASSRGSARRGLQGKA